MNAQLPMDFLNAARVYDRPLIVDSFAGGGGASTGIEQALGRSPDIAINHDPAALALHEANHPDTLHLSENVYRIDPLDHLNGKHIGLMWFSPDCKHFSKAKGGKPVARNIRDLAWIIPGWIERIQKSGGKVDVVMMENVEEFAGWGPLIETGKGLMPCPDRKGDTFNAWCKKIRQLGGKIERRELRACDYGAPTIRRRLFVIIRFDGQPIVWPEPTHGDPASDAVESGKLRPWRTAAECIDWSISCPSIFDSKEEIKEKYGLRAVRPLADNTLARVARGLHRYVLQADRPFLVNLTHGGRVEDVAEPFKTITGANRGEKAVIVPSIQRFASGSTGHQINKPLATITANSFLKRPGGAAPIGLLTPFLATMRNSQKPWQDADKPAHTVTAGGAGLTLCAPNLMSLKGTTRRDSDADAPHPTVLAGGGHSAIIAPVLTYAQQGGANRSIEDPHHTICASKKDQNSLIAATMVHVGNGEREGQAPRTLDVSRPLNTVVAGGVKQYPVAAYLAQQNGGPRMGSHAGHDIREPVSTVTGSGSHQTPVAAFFAKYYGTGDGARQDEPSHTVTTKDRFGHCEAQLHCPPFTDAHAARARKVADLLRQFGLWDDREFVTVEIDEQTFVVVDVGMRMLTPRELFNAQGFPADYVIEGVWRQDGDDWTFTEFPKTTQVRCVGNSVCPPVAEALARANAAHLIGAVSAA
ncbi:DNA cytosine methyltransferase [Tritonibacter mobilis]|uniref:DNA cytosine methyltransferase n=1 Tax=Tritonibacter mobilis TaxID=379347 RepID=UPI001C09F941|nr:DNA cytosine methyltransferase [Tritonibacter mobilis]MBU3035485.1 DNA cytosine methyltransferase [Tritonibacter mobilis]WHQ83945.1 DNA cytosine methyltransferase [Tritonibacter mobilis]